MCHLHVVITTKVYNEVHLLDNILIVSTCTVWITYRVYHISRVIKMHFFLHKKSPPKINTTF